MVDGVGCPHGVTGSGGVFASVQVAIEPWEVAAAELEAKTVTFAKDVAGGPDVNCEFVNLPRVYKCGLLL